MIKLPLIFFQVD